MNLRGWPGRLLLAAAGFAIIAYLVHGAGPARVLHVLLQAGPFLPVIVALELCQVASDILALRLLLGPSLAKVSLATWVRSSAVAYAMMILLPAGRAAGEVARATLIAKDVGTPTAATASVRLSVAYLAANGVASGTAGVVIASLVGLRTPLALLLLGNALLVSLSAAGLLALGQDARLGRWLNKMRVRFRIGSPSSDATSAAPRKMSWRAAAACAAGRCAQLLQYGVLLVAVGGAGSVTGAFVAQGIHLVGATLGDLLPNQLGVVDGTYRTFAPMLGLGADPARALSIAFVVHASQLSLAGVCVIVAALSRRPTPVAVRGPSSADADAHS